MTLPSAGVAQGQSPEIKSDLNLQSTQTSAAPTTQADRVSKVAVVKNIDGRYQVEGIRLADDAGGTNSVYQGLDEAGNAKYIGITERAPAARFSEHLNSIGTGKELLRYEAINGMENLSRINARIFEQSVINQIGKDNLLNVRNSIAPKYWSLYNLKKP